MKYIYLIVLTVLITGCASSGYNTFYKPYMVAKTTPNMEVLKEGQEPKIFGSDDFKRDVDVLASKRYKVLGVASFNGSYEGEDKVMAQAKRVGATVVLVKAEYTNTLTTNSTLFLPDNKTTYHSGSGSANTSYNSAYGGYLGSSTTNATHSGTSTTYGTKAVPVTSHQRRYNQEAIFLAKSNKKVRYGIGMKNLTPELSMEHERNAGALVTGIMEDSPAFYANVLKGDILITIDDTSVINAKQAVELMKNTDPNATSSVLTVIRKGKEKNITIKFYIGE